MFLLLLYVTPVLFASITLNFIFLLYDSLKPLCSFEMWPPSTRGHGNIFPQCLQANVLVSLPLSSPSVFCYSDEVVLSEASEDILILRTAGKYFTIFLASVSSLFY